MSIDKLPNVNYYNTTTECTNVNGKEDGMTKYYYTVDDVMQITGFKRSKCYAIIKKLNESLAEEGFQSEPGKIPIPYFKKKFYGFMPSES